ncbi:hypothetical protein SUGI_0357930 [Cryptomeria japonica]|nr:hypothetical protein SUGI_0357930 [Cryptomeria japonica]
MHTTKMYNQYWCSYGTEDNRKKSLNKKHDRTYQKKRGCTCHFIVKVLYGRPDLAILTLKQLLHVNKNGESCHAVDDTSNDLCSQFAPNVSDECKAYRERLLLMDVSIDAIKDKHLDDPIFRDMLKKRDPFVTRKDVINAQAGVPVAWAVTSRNKIEDIHVWLMELRRRAKEKRPDWRINAFITDDASVEIHAIE